MLHISWEIKLDLFLLKQIIVGILFTEEDGDRNEWEKGAEAIQAPFQTN